MNAAKQAAWLFCALIVLACSGWYFAGSTTIVKLDDKTLSQSPDTLVTNLTVRRFDEKGKLINYLYTPQMQHIPAENTNLLKTPKIIITQPGQPAWQISSEHAKAIHGSEQITFIRHVVVHQNKGERSQESTMKTEKLLYFTKEKLATTDLAVSFEQPGSIVHSQGMKAYLADKRVQLSKAHATYEPKHG
ncbi:LPS export ABC transporter periplasmic protein LptC [Legionella jamestowniensis]|uniref:Lipopolysaccharide export system protein LptC n=1 Tax=Legionella jamestowniensis TaxID=455 RepID=A0A0W0UHQ0_9GAMM|nr:LPS export ABC transporter periplasmic protein LptC [Legionella jamestowniensis]KTD07097.1 lipopolysaccharide export system protein LptC [Legionella jamestowniensis]SFL70841.1 lipopolysaccharide export system protein LptC [Legionella jamestowniensis DSM 19215]